MKIAELKVKTNINIKREGFKKRWKMSGGGRPFSIFLSFKLQIHVKSIHESVTFPCPQCQHRVKSKNSLMFHIQTVHEGKKPFSCPQCDFKGALEINIKAHIKSMHPSTLTCSICEYKVADENILLNHLNMFHGTDKGRRKSSP